MTLPAGALIGPYQIVGHLGSGAMGAVYRAFDPKLMRPVAIKALHERTSDTRLLLHEARSASALSHPNTSTVYEVLELDDQAYIVMEYVEGRSLRASMPADGLPIETCLRYGIQIADALAHAHDRGVIHRDLKSSNVVITPQGQAKVLDFGLAARQRTEPEHDATRSPLTIEDPASIVGTLAYMAPELLLGEQADGRSDIWSFGVLLHEMATGFLPFRAKTRAELVSVILRDPPTPLPPTLPVSFRRVVGRCLSKEPGQRYQRASEARAALETIHPGSAKTEGQRRRRATTSTGRPRRTRVRSLAVLPLTNLSSDPDQEYFAEGMTEALIADLAKISALKVTSRTSTQRYKGSGKSMPEIAAELGVDAVIEGSVVRANQRVRITAQLIDGTMDTHLWSESYERDVSDVLALQSEVAKAIAKEIRIKVTPKERARLTAARQVTPAAHEAYLRGRFHWNRRTAAALERGIEYFEQAIAIDADYADAHAGLAASYVPLAFFGYMSPKKADAKAEAAARAALALDDTLAEAHAVMAAINHDGWEWAQAEKEYRRAIALNPTYPTTHQWYAEHLIDRRRVAEAVHEANRARDLDPLSLPVNALHGYLHFYGAHDYESTIGILQKALELEPAFVTARWLLGLGLTMTGRLIQGIRELEQALSFAGGSRRIQASLAYAYARAGKSDRAAHWLAELERAADADIDFASDVAMVHVGRGDVELALTWLARAVEGRSIYLRHIRSDPRWDPIGSDPRFQDLAQRVGLDP